MEFYANKERRTKMNKLKKSFWSENKYLFYSFAATAGTMIIMFFITQILPFAKHTILRMDLYHQYGPLFSELYDRIFSHGSLAYSWTSGLGSCFLGNYFNYLSSPIGAIVVFFGHKHVPEAIAAMILIKVALASATFTYYINRSLKSRTVMGVGFGMLYAFCAYVLAYYWNVMWLDAVVLLPIILLGIEKIIDSGKIRTYSIALALSMFSNYYMSFMLCMFSVCYFFYYLIIKTQKGEIISPEYAYAHPKGLVHKFKNSRFWHSCFLFGIGSLLAGGLIAFALLPTYKVLQNCSATSGNFPEDVKTYFTFFDFFANHIGSLTTTIRSSGDDVLPNVYCGVITLILAPLYFFTKSISKKEKFVTLGLLMMFFASFNINYLNFIWHGLHFPNDLPYRFSFMYSFILLVMAYKAFLRLNEFTSRQIGATGLALVAFIFIVQDIQSKNVTSSSVILSLALIVIYVLMLTMLKDKKYSVYAVSFLLCVCFCSEAIICDTASMPNSVTRESYEGDYDEFRVVKDHLDTIEQEEFYRMELTNLRTRMDNSWFGYNGVSVFSSMAYESLSALEDKLGLMSNKINSYTYNPQTPVYNMMHALKYIVNNDTVDVLNEKYYKKITENGKFTAYQNKYYLPLGFCVDNDIGNWEYDNQNPFFVQADFFRRATGINDELFKKLPISYVNYSNTEPFTESLDLNKFKFTKTDKSENAEASASFFYKPEKDGNVYIFFDVEGGNSKNVTINSELGTVSRGASHSCLLDTGFHKAGETVTVNIPFEKESGYVTIYAYTMNEAVFEKGYNKLSKNTMQITKFDDTAIDAKFTANNNCVLYTSIPYDTGWKITIDGKEVSKKSMIALGDGLTAIKVKKGNHEINFTYHVPGMSTGIKITGFTVVMFLLWLAVSLLRKRSKKSANKVRVSYPAIDNTCSTDIFFMPTEKKPKDSIYQYGTRVEIYPPINAGIQKEIILPPENNSSKFTVENELTVEEDK